MKTEAIVTRKLFGESIRQRHKSELICANDIVMAGNKWRITKGYHPFNLQEFLRQKTTVEFINHLENKFGVAKMTGRGRKAGTWVHVFLAIDIALAISPELKTEVYSWITDELCNVRDVSGESFKLMTGSLYESYSNKYNFPKFIESTCLAIKSTVGVKDWETASKAQLMARDDIHKGISLLCDVLRNPEDAVQFTLNQYRKSLNK